jgi:hypothetical protein
MIKVKAKLAFIIYLKIINNIVQLVKFSNFTYWLKIDYEDQFQDKNFITMYLIININIQINIY